MKPDIVRRYAHNPILTKAEIPYPFRVMNGRARRQADGTDHEADQDAGDARIRDRD